MKNKQTPRQTREILKNVLNLGYSYIDSFGKELAKLQLTPEEIKENKPDNTRLHQASVIVNTMTCINDILHPAHALSLSLMDQKSIPFITQVIKQHEVAREKGIVSKGCPCESCVLRTANDVISDPTLETVENLTQDTKETLV